MLAMRGRGRPSLLAAVVAMAAVVAAVSAGCAGSATAGGRQAHGAATQAVTAAPSHPSPKSSRSASPSASPWPLVVTVPAAVAGEHQTGTLPPARSPMFEAEMTDLWAGVVSGRPDLARPAFFPLLAYEQVKAIADPAADWQSRLVSEFSADVIAAHDLIGGQSARTATLVRVIVPEDEADWISPGVCDNGVGYWHVAGARLVYRVGGQVMSFGISTLISWRGHWYVVHLGGEVRTSAGGMVDQPSAGPGVPGPPGGC
jgi:hypothetical protein